MLFLYVQVAITRNLPIVLQTASYISFSFSTLTDFGLKAVNALVNDESTPIGCAVFGKPSMIFFISSFTKVYFLISVSNWANCLAVGNSPNINRYDTSRKSALSARS